MENAQGKNTYYEIVLDNAQLKRDAEQAENIIRRIGDASKTEASRIESACMSVSGALKKLGAAVPVAELAKDIYGFADRFERSMAQVAIVSETVANNLGKFKQGIIEMSTEIPVPADEAAKAFYRIVSAGHDGAAGMEILRVSAKAAVGGITQTVAAADAITSILNAYNKGAGEAESISDRLFTAAQIGKTSMDELGHSIWQVIPVAASFGIESEQALAAVATLAKSGTPVAQAVMQVRAAIMAASEQLGDGYFNTYTLQQGLQEIAGRAAGSEAQLQALVPEIEGVNAILGLTGTNAQAAASDLEELMNSAGATETAFQKMAGETGSQLTMLKNNLLAQFSGLGESMVENVGKVAAALNEAFDTGEMDRVVSVLASLIAMYGTYKVTLVAIAAIEQVGLLAKKVQEYVQMARALGLATANQIALNRAALVNPYVAIASAIAAVVGGLVLFSVGTKEAEENMIGLARANKRAGEEYDAQAERVKVLTDMLHDGNAAYESRKKALEELHDIIPGYNAQLTTEGQLINDNTTAIRGYLTQLEKQIRLKAAQEELEEAYREKRKLEKNLKSEQDELSSAQQYNALVAGPAVQSKIGTSGMQAIAAGAGAGAMKDTSGILSRISQTQEGLASVIKTIADLNSEITTTAIAFDGTGAKSAEGAAKVMSYAGQVKATAQTIRRLRSELTELRAGKGNAPDPAAAILAKENELKQARARYKILLSGDSDGDGETASRQAEYDRIVLAARERLASAEIELERRKIDDKAKLIEFDREQTVAAIEKTHDEALQAWMAAGKNAEAFDATVFLQLIENVEAQAGLDTGSIIVERAKKEQAELEVLLGELRTYEQQRTAVEEAYEKKRRALYESDGQTLKKGVTQGNVDELDRSKTEALNGVDEQFAQRELTYQAWMDKIAEMTLDDLENALAQAKAALTEAEKSGAGGASLAAAKAKVTSVEKKVAKARAEDEVSPGKRSIKEWEKLHKALEGAEREFESIGKAVGGVAGEIVGTAGKVMTSTLGMVNSIVTLTKSASEGINTTSQVSSKAIQTVEKASAILAIISAAMSIATTIIGLFNDDEKKQKEIEKLQGRIDQLQWELDNADVMRLQTNTENALTLVKRMYAETTQEVLELHATSKKYADMIYQFCGRTLYQNEILKGSVEKLAAAYANIEYSAGKALGSAKYDEGKEQLKNIAEQQLLIQEQIKKEGAKKKTDPDKIKDWEHQIQELGLKAVGIINGLVEDIIGGSAADMASELGDAFIEAFRAGEDAAKAWGEKVNDIVADIVKRMLVQEFLEKPLGTLFNDYKEKWFDDGTFLGFGAVNDSMVGFAAELNALIAGFQGGMDGLPEELRNLMLSNADSAREASEKGIATASQESVDELSGRATAIQGHTYSIMESSRLLVANSSLILMHLAGIETNTRQLARLERIENDMGSVKNTVNDIALKGLKLKS